MWIEKDLRIHVHVGFDGELYINSNKDLMAQNTGSKPPEKNDQLTWLLCEIKSNLTVNQFCSKIATKHLQTSFVVYQSR